MSIKDQVDSLLAAAGTMEWPKQPQPMVAAIGGIGASVVGSFEFKSLDS